MRAREVNGVVELGVVCLDHIESARGRKAISDLLEQQMVRIEFRVPLRGGHVVGGELVSTRQVRNNTRAMNRSSVSAVGTGAQYVATGNAKHQRMLLVSANGGCHVGGWKWA